MHARSYVGGGVRFQNPVTRKQLTRETLGRFNSFGHLLALLGFGLALKGDTDIALFVVAIGYCVFLPILIYAWRIERRLRWRL